MGDTTKCSVPHSPFSLLLSLFWSLLLFVCICVSLFLFLLFVCWLFAHPLVRCVRQCLKSTWRPRLFSLEVNVSVLVLILGVWMRLGEMTLVQWGGGKTSGKTPTPKHAFLLFRGRQDIAGGAICPERV